MFPGFDGSTSLKAMRRRTANNAQEAAGDGAAVGIEAALWQAAGILRNNMDAAPSIHVHPRVQDRRLRA